MAALMCEISHLAHGAAAPSGPRTPNFRSFTITLRHTTLCKTPLEYEYSDFTKPENFLSRGVTTTGARKTRKSYHEASKFFIYVNILKY
jgi:hypothetical protein